MNVKTGWRCRERAGGAWLLLVVLAVLAAGQAVVERAEAQSLPDSLGLEARRQDRRIDIQWSQVAELSDSLFGGYNVWRSISPDPNAFMLVRRFQRRYPVTWTYGAVSNSPCTPFTSSDGSCRKFVDPDSIVALEKIQITAQGDSAIARSYVGVSPFNGFPYHYAVTWFSECLTARNDTLWVEQPQPEIFTFMRGGEEHFGFTTEGGDTLEVQRIPCRRINPVTNIPTGDTTFVYQGTVESEIALRNFAVESTQLESPIYPSTLARNDLSAVTVIPNPYIASAPWDEPGQRKIQFVNLTREARVRIFTVGADLVRELDHPVSGSAPDQGSIDWDLKNADGRLVEPGIYIWQVEQPGAVADVVGRLVIVR